ncbi:MAG TPA: chemotaxis protein CheW [Candidatus Krumholzibacteria bacterium]|nr:chemotaxis protein CheW [Candidatus Krumholzibacteria bacterium]HPD70431.1 chemotaxis protein CheW [Candidatus Krumholzibacteria bacterium]HRY39869.1 chemotaxis protein CheW [Candidatus Krumholzibacteria bacterium]
MSSDVQSATLAKPGKYLSFVLGREEYGLEILKVQEIIGIMEVTRVPRTPPYVRGVINLRGRVIPVVDLRSKFRMPILADTEKTCVIVVQVGQQDLSVTMGVIVDEVSEVLSFTQDQIEPAPYFGGGMDEAEYVIGMGKLGKKVVILLDADRVLKGEELAAVAQAAH